MFANYVLVSPEVELHGHVRAVYRFESGSGCENLLVEYYTN